ncbi:MAG: DnaA ATPase domain-containing protein, partial [Phycisphaerales bacterium]
MTTSAFADTTLRPSPAASTPDEVRGVLAAAMGSDRFARYFGDDSASLSLHRDTVALRVPNAFIAETLRRRFGEQLEQAVQHALGAEANLRFEVDPEASDAASAMERAVAAAAPTAPQPRAAQHVGPGATWRRLEDFVVGDSNRLAYEASLRVAGGAPHEQFGGLFLHGVSGVGKTHLLQGIVTRFRAAHPGAKVRYTTGEQFTNAFIQSLKSGSLDEFRRRHRGLDLLCIDDVHFLSQKSKTQDELLHTFDALDLSGARVVLASDEHPHKIARFCERLVSRFISGMVVRLDRPDAATRSEIARRMLLKRGLTPAPGASDAIAARCEGSVRELEGAVTRVAAVRELLSDSSAPTGVVDAACVERALGRSSSSPKVRRPISTDEITDAICDSLDVSKAEVLGNGRHKRVVLARSLAAFLARRLTTRSFPEIAKDLRRPSHSSVVTACKRLAAQLQENLVV